MAVEYIHLLTLLMGTADCHEISKVFSVPTISGGWIHLSSWANSLGLTMLVLVKNNVTYISFCYSMNRLVSDSKR